MTEHNPTPPVRPSNVPVTGLLVSGTVLALALLTCITLLSWHDKHTDEITRIVNTLFNFISVLAGGGAFAYARTAAHNAAAATDNSAKAVVQTNGGLDARIQEAVIRALEDNRAEPGGTTGYTSERRR